MGVHLPNDVIFNHILPSITAKSVYRFKCVSKEWRSFLTSDMFQNKYNRLHVDDHKLLILSKTTTSFEFTTVNREAPPSVKGLTPTRRPLPPFEGITPGSISILASFHGLVCLGISIDGSTEYSNIILWNPLTNEYKRLSRSNSLNIWYIYSDYGLYYNWCEDDYKLLHVNYIDNTFYIYSLKSDSWRKLDILQQYLTAGSRSIICMLFPQLWSRGTYLNENLYFLQDYLTSRSSSIIRFDTKTEQLSKIETPNVDADPHVFNYIENIMVKSDCIHFCVKYDITCDSGFSSTCIKLWKLDESEKMKEVVTYQLRTHAYDIPIGSLIPFHLTKNGEWLMRACDNHQIYKVDLKKKMHIKDKGKRKRKRKEKGNIYDDLDYEKVRVGDNTKIVNEEVIYIETFVSPNRYMK